MGYLVLISFTKYPDISDLEDFRSYLRWIHKLKTHPDNMIIYDTDDDELRPTTSEMINKSFDKFIEELKELKEVE